MDPCTLHNVTNMLFFKLMDIIRWFTSNQPTVLIVFFSIYLLTMLTPAHLARIPMARALMREKK